MPKISTLSLGNFIRDPRNAKKVLRIDSDAGNAFICYPVQKVESGRVTVDTTRYEFIPKDQNVEQVTV